MRGGAAGAPPGAGRAGLRHHPRQFLLRLSDVGLVLEDHVHRVLHEFLLQRRRVEREQCARPVERLADRRGLLQVEVRSFCISATTSPAASSIPGTFTSRYLASRLPRRGSRSYVQAAALQGVAHLRASFDVRNTIGRVFASEGPSPGRSPGSPRAPRAGRPRLGIRLVDLVESSALGSSDVIAWSNGRGTMN